MLEATEIVSTGSDEKQEDKSTTKGLHFAIQHTIQNTGWTSNLKVLNGGQSSTITEPIPSSTNTLPNVPNTSILRGIDLRETPVILVQTPFKFNPDDASSKNLMLKIMPMAPVMATVKPARTIPLTTTRIPNKVEQPVKRKPTLEVMDYRLLGKKRKTTTASNDVVTLSIPSIACQSTVSSISTPSLLKPNESLKINNIISSSETKSTSQLILCNKDTTEVPPPPKECTVPEGEVSLPPENIKKAARMKFDAILKSEIENHRMKSIKGGAVASEKVSTSGTTGSGKTCAIALGSGVSNQVSQLVRIENAKIVKVHEVVKPVQPTTASNPTIIFPSNLGQTSKGSSSSLTSKSIIINTGFTSSHKKPMKWAEDISGHKDAPAVIYPAKMVATNVPAQTSIEVKTDVNKNIYNGDSSSKDCDDDEQTFTYDPLYISSDTLVPVTSNRSVEKMNSSHDPLDKGASDNVTRRAWDESKQSNLKGPMLRCFLCPYYHTKERKIARHWINNHLSQKPYQCPYCSGAFTTSWEVQDHIEKIHSDSKMTINIKPSNQFAAIFGYELDKGELNLGHPDEVVTERSLIMNSDMPFSCKKCEFSSESLVDLKKHSKNLHLKYKPFFCKYCQKRSFSCDFDLKQHVKRFHPERIPSSTSNKVAKSSEITADIDWSACWEEIVVLNKVCYQCRSCTFRSQVSDKMIKHALQTHNFPSEIKCPTCSAMIKPTEIDRENLYTSCRACVLKIFILAEGNITAADHGDPIYICKVCDYKTLGKGSMNRHIKYNHTKCRPFGCGYCNYVAVERPKVRLHIASLHPGEPFCIKEKTESSDVFRRVIDSLFNSLVKIAYSGETAESAESGASSGHPQSDIVPSENDGKKDESSPLLPDQEISVVTPSLLPGMSKVFCCNSCTYQCGNVKEILDHQQAFHMDKMVASSRDRMILQGEHFKCTICEYCCVDRSCMSRHVKYMHITARPHSCPYCTYNNVEKTKVRLHVRSHHPSLPKFVRTDQKVLEEMSYEAKRFYVRVDKTGQEIVDNANNSSQNDVSSLEIEILKDDADDSDDDLPDDFILTKLANQTDFLDVLDGAAEARDGVIRRKAENDELIDVVANDVEMRPSTSRPSFGRDSDHTYITEISAVSDDSLQELIESVKCEPFDSGYEKAAWASSFKSVAGGSRDKYENLSTLNDLEDMVTSAMTESQTADGKRLSGEMKLVSGDRTSSDLDLDDDDEDFDDDDDFVDIMSDFNSDSMASDVEEDEESRTKRMQLWEEFDHVPVIMKNMEMKNIQMEDWIRYDPKINMKPVVILENLYEVCKLKVEAVE